MKGGDDTSSNIMKHPYIFLPILTFCGTTKKNSFLERIILIIPNFFLILGGC
jgi:hypothetical protein